MTSSGRRVVAAAFTLLELLIVVAMIAILIAILLPSLSRAREQANAVKCVSNLSTISKGMFYYVSDPNDGRGYLPQLGADISLGFWTAQIFPYVKIKRSRVGTKDGLLVCPSDPNPQYRWIAGTTSPRPGAEATVQDKLVADSGQGLGRRRRGSGQGTTIAGPLIEPVSYSGSCDTLETRRVPGVSGHHGFVPAKWTEIKRPHCYLLLTEVKRTSAREARCFRLTDLLNDAMRFPDFKRHYGKANPNTNGSNFLFADGHAQWHSARYAAEDLICCIDLGVDIDHRGTLPSHLSNVSEAVSSQQTHCGGNGGAGRRRR